YKNGQSAGQQDGAGSPDAGQGGVGQGDPGQGGSGDAGTGGYNQWDRPPEMRIEPARRYTGTMETSPGTLTLQLCAEEVLRTVNNFVFLAREGFYDGVTSHRIIKDFMIQGGDPTGTGTGGPGYTIPDEYPVTRPYKRGTLAMARTA